MVEFKVHIYFVFIKRSGGRLPVYTMKTNNSKHPVYQYIIDAIDAEGYEVKAETVQERLQFIANCFTSEYCHPYEVQRTPNVQQRMADWLAGLPSSITIDFEYYRIIEIAKQWGSIPQDADDRQGDKILNNWFLFIAGKILQLMRKHKVTVN